MNVPLIVAGSFALLGAAIHGLALLLSGAVLDGDTRRTIGLLAASASTGLAAVSVGIGAAYARTPRFLLRHPGPAVLAAAAALSWWEHLDERPPATRVDMHDARRSGFPSYVVVVALVTVTAYLMVAATIAATAFARCDIAA
jgi:hypothetical protein